MPSFKYKLLSKEVETLTFYKVLGSSSSSLCVWYLGYYKIKSNRKLEMLKGKKVEIKSSGRGKIVKEIMKYEIFTRLKSVINIKYS